MYLYIIKSIVKQIYIIIYIYIIFNIIYIYIILYILYMYCMQIPEKIVRGSCCNHHQRTSWMAFHFPSFLINYLPHEITSVYQVKSKLLLVKFISLLTKSSSPCHVKNTIGLGLKQQHTLPGLQRIDSDLFVRASAGGIKTCHERRINGPLQV